MKVTAAIEGRMRKDNKDGLICAATAALSAGRGGSCASELRPQPLPAPARDARWSRWLCIHEQTRGASSRLHLTFVGWPENRES